MKSSLRDKIMTQQWKKPSFSASKTKTTITTPIQRNIPQCSAGSMNISTKLPTRNFYLETIGQFNINGLFLSGRCRYVSILHCFYSDEPNADRQDSAGICLPLSSFFYRWIQLRLSWAVLKTSGTATATTRTSTTTTTATAATTTTTTITITITTTTTTTTKTTQTTPTTTT